MNKDQLALDILVHKLNLTDQMNKVIKRLIDNSLSHDVMKLESPEIDIHLEYTDKLKGLEYGSKEYQNTINEMLRNPDCHYNNNSHHPESSSQGIKGMTLIDLIEMLCDWYVASNNHPNGNMENSLEINQKRFGYSDELQQIFKNTITELEEL